MTSPGRRVWGAGLAVTLLVAGVVSLVASGSPDGLEWVAGQLGFADAARDHPVAASPLAGYGSAGAGLIGTVVVLALATGLFWLIRRRTPGSDA